MGEMSIEDTHACMKHSTALVNTSESEGMAAVLLEVAVINFISYIVLHHSETILAMYIEGVQWRK